MTDSTVFDNVSPRCGKCNEPAVYVSVLYKLDDEDPYDPEQIALLSLCEVCAQIRFSVVADIGKWRWVK